MDIKLYKYMINILSNENTKKNKFIRLHLKRWWIL